MKDLFKGHHPWLLVLVFTAALLLAGILRHTFLSFGHTYFNANLTFIIALLAVVSMYALFYEYLREGTFPKLFVSKPLVIQEKAAPEPPIVESTINKEVSEERPRYSFEDFMAIKEAITADVLMAVNSQNTKPSDNANGISTLQVNLSKVQHENLLAREEEQKRLFDEACQYSIDELGAYIPTECVEVLFGRLMRFMQAVSATWEVRSAKEMKENVEAAKIMTHKDIAKIDLLHYGWNMGLKFGKSGLQIGYFLKTTFGHHFDRLSVVSISKKLTMKGPCIIIRKSEFHKDFKNKKHQNLDEMVRDYEAEHHEAEKRAKRKKALEEKEKREAERERIRMEKEKEDARMAAIIKKNPKLQPRLKSDPVDVEIIENPYYDDDYYEDDEWEEDENLQGKIEDETNFDEDAFDRHIMKAMAEGKSPECFDDFDLEDLSA